MAAKGEIRLGNKPNELLVSKGDVWGRAYRTCSLGSATCGFADVKMKPRNDGSLVADVSVECKISACANSDEALQAGLDRLAAKLGVETPKSASIEPTS